MNHSSTEVTLPLCCDKKHIERSQEPQQRVLENGRAEELFNRATLEIMIDKIRQQSIRLLPYTYFLIIIAITIII